VGPALQRNKKKRKWSRWRGLLQGRDWWAAGPPGRKGEEVSFLFFIFFFKLFSSQTFKLKFKPNFFKLFTKFYNLLKVTQATKNHAEPRNDAQPLVISILIKLSLIF
jgi:hypothetical protein